PDVLFGDNTFVVQELQRATRTLPIIFARVTSPIESGFVASLARPGGNITGFADSELSSRNKLSEIMRETAPEVSRVVILGGTEEATTAASLVGLRASLVRPQSPLEIEEAIAALAKEPNGGLIVVGTPFLILHRKLIIDLAARYKLPAVYRLPVYARDGGLM